MHNQFQPYLEVIRGRLLLELPLDRVEDTLCEIAAHLELDYEDLTHRGMSHEEALGCVLARFGSARPIAAQLADADSLRLAGVPIHRATLFLALGAQTLSAVMSFAPVIGYLTASVPSMALIAFLTHLLGGMFMATSFLGKRWVPSVIWGTITLQAILALISVQVTSGLVHQVLPFTAFWTTLYILVGHAAMVLLGRGLVRHTPRAA